MFDMQPPAAVMCGEALNGRFGGEDFRGEILSDPLFRSCYGIERRANSDCGDKKFSFIMVLIYFLEPEER